MRKKLTQDELELRIVHGNIIRTYRCMLDMKAREMAIALNVSPQQYCDYEKGLDPIPDFLEEKVRAIFNGKIDSIIADLQNQLNHYKVLKQIHNKTFPNDTQPYSVS